MQSNLMIPQHVISSMPVRCSTIRNFEEIISPDVLQREKLYQDNSGSISGGFEARRKVVEQYFTSKNYCSVINNDFLPFK